MALEIKKVEYFNITVDSNADVAYKLLSKFSEAGISLLAFRATPTKDRKTLFSLFPNDSLKMIDGAKKAVIDLDGPYSALIIKSDTDEPGECADIFRRLSQVDIKNYEFSGIADIKNSYGIILYLQQEECEKALVALTI